MTKTKDIVQTVTFAARPSKIYEILMDSKKHAAIKGRPAKMSKKIGGEFRAHNNYIYGINLYLVPGKHIVQAWRGNSGWPEGHFSIVSYELSPVKGGTKLLFTHIGIPAKEAKHINSGWKSEYWDPMKKMLAKK